MSNNTNYSDEQISRLYNSAKGKGAGNVLGWQFMAAIPFQVLISLFSTNFSPGEAVALCITCLLTVGFFADLLNRR